MNKDNMTIVDGEFYKKEWHIYNTKFSDLEVMSMFIFNNAICFEKKEICVKTDVMLFHTCENSNPDKAIECRVYSELQQVVPLYKVSNLPIGQRIRLLKDLEQAWVIKSLCDKLEGGYRLANKNAFISLSVKPDELCILTN